MSQSVLPSISKTGEHQETFVQTDLRLGIRTGLLMGLFLAVLLVFMLSLAVGSVNIPVDQIIKVLLGGEAERTSWTNIVLKFRLPKAFTAMLAGAALGVSGLMMQTFFRNPLADPFILGVNSGASLGVALVVLAAGRVSGSMLAGFGLSGDLLLTMAAAMGAAITLLIVLLVAQRVQSSMTLLILGIMLAQVTYAIVSLLIYFSVTDSIKSYVNWTAGSFGGVTWGQMKIFAPVALIALVCAYFLIKPLNALLLGEAYARSMGMNVQRARIGIILVTALLAGAVTAFCGPIGFLGTAVPHLCRSLFNTSDHRTLLPASVLMGALVAMIASLAAGGTDGSQVLPLNAVTSLIGAPIVIWVIMRQGNLHKSFVS